MRAENTINTLPRQAVDSIIIIIIIKCTFI